jgi:hypothetical protein
MRKGIGMTDHKPGSLAELMAAFQDRESFLTSLVTPEGSWRRQVCATVLMVEFSSFYGVVMGSYNGLYQALASGVKLPMLFVLSIAICFPAFFILQQVLGSRLTLKPMLGIILSGFVMISLILASFAPIILFFMITSTNYAFLKLLHVAVFALAGLFGMKTILDALQFACEKQQVYPKIGVTVFRCWVLILAFVGMQLAWTLRPFVGSRSMPFELFRQREGNFYLAVGQSAISLLEGRVVEERQEPAKNDNNGE